MSRTASYVFVCLVNLIQLRAQVASGILQGTISDAKGAPIPSAVISVANLATNALRTTASNAKGFYSVSNLPPGSYAVTVSHQGFLAAKIQVPLVVGEQRQADLRMKAGDSSTNTRTTESGAAAPQTATSAVSSAADADTVRDLPSNGRDWTQAATLQAGVSSVKTQPDAGNADSGRGQRGFGAQISISGGRPQQNNYILNGVSINDYANSAPGSVLGLDLGADAVEQFSVVTSNYPADYGRSSGGVINAVTRSGGNAFHGSAYEFLRNSALDARNFFDGTKPPFRRNQFGAAAGGAIKSNRTFFFANFEGLRQSLGVTHVDTVPSPAARAGLLSTGMLLVNPITARYLAFYPLPNRGLLGSGDTGVFAFSGQQITPESYFTGRIDHKIGSKDSLSGSYVFDTSQTTQPDQLNLRINGIVSRRNVLSISQHHVFNARFLNSFRFGVNRVVASIGQTPSAINPIAADTSYGFIPAHTSGSISILGLTTFAGGLGSATNFDFHWTSLQIYDDASKTAGAHSLRFGIALEGMRDNMAATQNPNGIFAFNSLSEFLTNRPYSLAIPLPQAANSRGLRQTLFAGYFQDDVRLAAHFTVNLGVRYETASVPTEAHDMLSNLRALTDSSPRLGSPYFSNPTRVNFEPRVGLAWDPLGTGRVVVRAGFGIFDVLPLPYEFELVSLFAAPYFRNATPTNLAPDSFPANAVNTAYSASIFRYVHIQPDPGRNYVNQWNANLELRPTTKSSVLLGYVGSRGIHQPFRADDNNIVPAQATPQGYLWPSPTGSGTKLNPGAGRVDTLAWIGDSYYHALQVGARADVRPELNLRIAYTWGKSIDTGSATIAGDQFANSISSLPLYDLRLVRGLSDFNIAQTLSIRATYEPPAPGFLRRHPYLSHWRVNATIQHSTGAPFTPVIGGDPLGTRSTDPYDVPDRNATQDCANPVNQGNPTHYLRLACFAFPQPSTRLGNLARNSIVGPALSNLDLSVFKDTFIKRISETFDVQVRVEAFNVLNHANFAPPLNHRALYGGTGAPVPGAGLIDSTATPSRQTQLGLKILW